MARISYLEKTQAPEEVQTIYAQIEKATGRIPNLIKAMAHSPTLLRQIVGYNQAIRNDTQLDPKLRELAYLKTSQLNRCHY